MQCVRWHKSIMRVKTTALSSDYRCENCNRTLHSDCFYKSYIKSNRFRCRECVTQLNRLNNERGQYDRIINTLRNSENELYKRSCKEYDDLGIAYNDMPKFTLSMESIVYIVNIIWKGESAIQRADNDHTSLVVVRWNLHSPFMLKNNVVLTAKQAKIHYTQQLHSTTARELLYGTEFCAFVEQKLNNVT